ncbi:hypothetical protein ACSYAD_23120 [Acaryochloris marina NIES-2412]|uniref:hypothetical protein n=1 Tax=Acaryochloris marina TaxID=155978 RepID=UPI0040586980
MNYKTLNCLIRLSLTGVLASGCSFQSLVSHQSSQDLSDQYHFPALSERDEIGRLKRTININGKDKLGDQFIGASRVKDRIEIWKQTDLIRSGDPKSLNALAKSDCDKALRIFGIGPINMFPFDPIDIEYSDEQAPDAKLFRCDVMAARERDRQIRLVKP